MIWMRFSPFHMIRKFTRREDGVALVEFALFLPLFVLAFFVIVEFARSFFSYQGAVVGVRDAARYMARVTDADICVGASDNQGLIALDPSGNVLNVATGIITRNMDTEIVGSLPTGVSLTNVTTLVVCDVPAAGTYRQTEVPIVRVAATIEILLPLGGILELNGLPLLPSITSTIIDESRVYGV